MATSSQSKPSGQIPSLKDKSDSQHSSSFALPAAKLKHDDTYGDGLIGENSIFGNMDDSQPSFLYNDDLDDVVDNEDVKKKIQEVRINHCMKKGENIDIGAYLEDIDKQLSNLNVTSVKQYMNEREGFAQLYQEMTAAEEVLGQMESLLTTFQKDLGSITDAIFRMQREAKLKELQVEQRRSVQQDLSKFINSAMLPDNLKRALTFLSIDESYVIFLKEYARRLNFISQFKNQTVRVVAECEADYTQLTVTVCERILEWINQKFSMAFIDLTSLNALHKQLAKFRYLFVFLGKWWPEKGTEVITYYVNQTKAMYFNHYRQYCLDVKKSILENTHQEDLIAYTEGKLTSLFKGGAAQNRENRLATFTLGRRTEILHCKDKPANFPLKFDSNKKFPFELVFRVVYFMFLNDVIEESTFNQEVLSMDLIESIFDKAGAVIFRFLEEYLDISWDMIAMMILMIMVYQYSEIMSTRKEPFAGHLNSLTEILATRLKFIFDQNVQSITLATPDSLGGLETQHAHYVVKRYAEFLGSCMALLTQYPDALKIFRLKTKLPVMRAEMEKLITKMGTSFGNDKIKTMRFFVNNYDCMHQVTLKYPGTEHETHFSQLVDGYVHQFADQLLTIGFGFLIRFVKDNATVDITTAQVQYRDPTADPRFVEDILKKFHESWKTTLKESQTTILQGIPNNDIAHQIVKLVFKDVYFYYRVLSDIVRQFYKSLISSKYLLPQTELEYEIKSYLKPNHSSSSSSHTPDPKAKQIAPTSGQKPK